MYKQIFAALALAAATVGVQAGTYSFAVNGSGSSIDDGTFCFPGGSSYPYCAERHPFDWSGSLSFVTASDADGVYSIFEFSGDSTPKTATYSFSKLSGGILAQISYTLSGGAVSALTASFYELGAATVHMNLTTASLSGYDCHHCGSVTATGTVTAVPEPSTWVLLAAGLGAVGWASRRRAHANAFQARQRALIGSASGV